MGALRGVMHTESRFLAGRWLVLALVFSSRAVSAQAPVDRQGAFDRSFPRTAGGVIDWQLYSALVDGDVLAWAAAVDPAVAVELAAVRDKGYQLQRLRARLEHDAQLRAIFEQQRKRLPSIVLYADVNGESPDPCHRSVIYTDGEFRLLLGESSERGDPLALATIAPGCPLFHVAGLQLTAGRSSRFKCWTGDSTVCGWQLRDMPETLKRVIETEYPRSIKLRWSWRGLSGKVPVRYPDTDGYGVDRERITVVVPAELALQFLGKNGELLWTASAATRATRSSAQEPGKGTRSSGIRTSR